VIEVGNSFNSGIAGLTVALYAISQVMYDDIRSGTPGKVKGGIC